MYVVIVIYGDHRNIHVPKHSFPTRRSSEHADSVPCSFGSTTLTTSRDMPTRLVAIVIPARIIARWNAVDGAAAPALVIDTCYFPCIACCRSEEHTSELQSIMRISYAVFRLKKQERLRCTSTHPTHTR